MASVPQPWLESPPALPPWISSLPWREELVTATAGDGLCGGGTPASVPPQGAGSKRLPPLWCQQWGRAWPASQDGGHCLRGGPTGTRGSQRVAGQGLAARDPAREQGQLGAPGQTQAPSSGTSLGPRMGLAQQGPWPGRAVETWRPALLWCCCSRGWQSRWAAVGSWALGRIGEPWGRQSLGTCCPPCCSSVGPRVQSSGYLWLPQGRSKKEKEG